VNQIVLIQPNFKIGGGSFTGYWLPYSVGCLWSYAAQEDWVRDNFEVADIIYKREKPCKLVERIKDCKVFFFSCYMWNWEYNKHVAQKIKESNPDSIIVFGGPQVTSRPEEEQFFAKHPYVDSISLSEGEQSFVAMLDKVVKGEILDKIYQGGRLTELDIPSPYLAGVFDKIMAEAPAHQLWNGTIETNRGCPFACTFCDWGSLTYAKIKKFPIPKVLQELTWMSENKVDYVTIADANFGVFTDRDLEFTEKLVELQNEYGYPKVVDATWYKNSSDEILEIVKKFISSGFNRGLTLSVQSMDMDVLEEIKRRNMEMSDLKMIFDKCNREGIPSYTELILGLPKETYESWKRGVCEVLDAGQHNAIESWLAQLLENAHMNLPEEREKHGLTTVIVENYISGFEEEDNIPEKVELVTGTKYMPTPKFIDAWSYSWMINNFHNFGWSQVITRFLRMYKDYSYEMMYDKLLDNIKEDKGPVGNAFNEARALLAEYLETGEIGVASGHTLMWEAQKDFHRFPHAVEKLVKDTFTDKFCDLDPNQFFALMTAQENYTTKEDHYYPHQVLQEYNIYEYINGIDDLKKADVIYDIDIGEKVKGEEYFNRLYFRRRQGWGKSIIKNTTKNT
jgi:putative methyltransferase